MILKYGLSIIAIISGMGVSATTTNAESLHEALVQTYETNPEIAAKRAGLRATDESVPQALSNWRPKVELDASYCVRLRDRDWASAKSFFEASGRSRKPIARATAWRPVGPT